MTAQVMASPTSRSRTKHAWLHLVIAVMSASLATLALLELMGGLSRSYPVQAAGTVRYVAPDGMDAGNLYCNDSGNPCASAQHAVNVAQPGDEIRFAAGVYTGVTFTSGTTQLVHIDKSIILHGGFSVSDWTTADPALNPTVFDAERQGHVMYIAGSASPTVTGLIIQNGDVGDSANGGGIYVQGGAPMIVANVISSNVAGHGGGVYNNTGSPRLDDNIFYRNRSVNGGGFFSNGGTPSTRNNVFHNNQATSAGGGVANNISSTLLVQHDVLYGNEADTGGGLVNAGSALVINSVVFSNTAGTSGGGVYNLNGSTIIDYSDVASNTGGDFSSDGGIITVTVDTISQDPLFVDAPNGDFHLQAESPVRDAGTVLAAVDTDFDGQARPFGLAYDMGPDEYYPDSPCFARADGGRVYTSAQAAVDAVGPGGLVQVAGYCVETISISQSLTLRGGYTTTNWLDPRYRTTLDAGGAGGRTVYVTGTGTVALENLHITGGQVNGDGAGLYLGPDVQATLQNDVIYGNQAVGGYGGGVYNAGGEVLIQHNTLYDNTGDQGGGGIYAGGSGVLTLRNSIIANNTASGFGGGGIYGGSANFALDYNDFYANNGGDVGGGVAPGPHDISVPPGLSDPANADFHLDVNTSQVINRADPASPLSTDFEGDPRPMGTYADIGADESTVYGEVALGDAPEHPYLVTDPALVKGTSITFSHVITNLSQSGLGPDSFDIETFNSDGWPVSLSGVSSPLVINPGQSFAFEVVVAVPAGAGDSLYNQTVITASSQAYPAAFDTVVDLIASPGVELVPNYTRNADPGQVLTYTHTLSNTGPMTDTFNVTYDSSLGWLSSITPTGLITLGAHQGQLIVAQVRVTDTAPANLADIMTIRATSINYPGISATGIDTTIANPTTGDRFVATSGGDANNNCTQQDNPCASVSYAVNQAAAGDSILVARGTYQDANILLKQNLNLQGGYVFNGSEFSLPGGTIDPSTTIIDAQHRNRGLLIQVPAVFRPQVKGFTIKNADSSGVGGGLYVQASSAPTLSQLIILDSSATSGGGIYLDVGNPVLEQVVISGTAASDRGGGIYINGGSPLLDRVVISNTTAANGAGIYNAAGQVTGQELRIAGGIASERGGGLYQQNGTLTISQTRISSSTASMGGGLYAAGGGVTLWNNFIYNNSATGGNGGGVYQGAGNLSLVNNTFYGNQAAGSGGGIYEANTTSLAISNTILAANQAAAAGGGLYRNGAGSLALDYNNLWNNTAASSPDSNVPAGPHSISDNPLFVNAAAGDLHLSFDSPSVDSADPATFLKADIEGDIRPVNQGFDMGADEVSGCLARVINPGDQSQVGPVYGIVQAAVDAAPEDYVVQVAGVCRGAQPRLVAGQWISQTVLISQSLTLEGGYDSDFNSIDQPTILDAQGQGRVVVITNTNTGLAATVVISRMLLTGGAADGLGGGPSAGGGIYNYGNDAHLVGSVISANQAIYGGGLYDVGGTLSFSGEDTPPSNVVSNTATYGGGAYFAAGTPALTNIQFQGNSADQGGAVYNTASLLSVEAITVTANLATSGAGFYNEGGGQLELRRSVVLSNSASSDGGGVYNTGVLTMVNTILAGNTSDNDGAGLYNTSENLAVRHDTFYANVAGSQGGGIYHEAGSSSPIINSSLLIDNSAGEGGGIYSANADPSFDYNDASGNLGGDAGGNLSLGDGTGNISQDPNFLSTDSSSSDFLRIPAGSPAEDAADPNSPVSVDIDLDPRPSNQASDIGADEVGGCYVRNPRLDTVFGNIQVAVNQSQGGDRLQVAGICQGVNQVDLGGGQVVTQTVFLDKSLAIQGGYDASDWNLPPEPVQRPTILDALAAGRVAYVTNAAVISISGLHLRQGSGDDGGAIFVGSGVLTMTESLVYSSTAVRGGGLYNQAGNVFLYRGHFTPTEQVYDNQIFANTASQGGGVYNAGGQIILDDNVLRDNQATSGGAFYHAGGTSVLQNNIIRDNDATDGAGVYNDSSALTVRHNTLYANAASGNGGGLYSTNGAPAVANNIFADNTASTGQAVYGPLSLDYNDAYPPAADAYAGGAAAGSHSLAEDPRFVNAAGGDFHLQDTSPVIDRGDPAMEPIFDFEGHLRPGDQGFDMGADERLSCLAKIVRTEEIFGNLQRAIDYSQAGDEIRVATGTCQGVQVNGALAQTIQIPHNLNIFGMYRPPEFIDPFRGYASPNFTSQLYGGVAQDTFDPLTDTLVIPAAPNAPGLTGRAVVITDSAVVAMEGFMLIGGNAAGQGGGPGGGAAGGGLYIAPGSQADLSFVDPFSNTADYGGAIYNGGTLSLRAPYGWYNHASADGGAIFNATGVLTLTTDGASANGTAASNRATSLIWNTAGGKGGGIYNQSGQVHLVNEEPGPGDPEEFDTIALNEAGQGGGIYNETGAISASRFHIYGNSSAEQGGGIYNSAGTLTLENNEIFENNAQGTSNGLGGGIYNGGSANLDLGNRLYDNAAAQDGGAIYNSGSGDLTLWNTLIYSNTAVSEGGGVYAAGSSQILHNTFYHNQTTESTARGGGIFIESGSHTVKNNIFHSNSASDSGGGGGIYATAGTVDYNDYYDNAPDHVHGGVVPGANSLVGVDPELPGRAQADFHLSSTSPAINQAEALGVAYDFEEDPRPVNAGPDIGADEQNACLARIERTEEIYGRIQAALDNAISGDVVQVAQGVCEESIVVDRDVTISGSWLKDFSEQDNDPVSSIVDAQLLDRVVTLAGGTTVTIRDIRLTNGDTSGNGGGILSQADELTLTNVWVVGNSADNGGGIYVQSGSAHIDAQILNNDATSDGGGIYNASGANVTIESNLLDWIMGNQAIEGNGGGVYNAPGSTVTIGGGSTIEENEAYTNGGGVYNDGANLTIGQKQINHNSATTGNGGGIFITGNSDVSLINLGLYRNSAQTGGGLYRSASGSTTMYHATIRENQATAGAGGGVYNSGTSSMAISASIVASNTSTISASGVHGTGGNVDIAYTLRWANDYSGAQAGAENQVGDPRFQDVFYPLQVSPGSGALHYDSPAIEAVPNEASSVGIDRTGDPRPQMCIKDMGRDEYAVHRAMARPGPTPTGATLTPTETITYAFSFRNDSENWTALSEADTSLGAGTGYTETVTATLISSRGWADIVAVMGGAQAQVQPDGQSATFDIGPGQTVVISVTVSVPAGTFATVESDDSTKEFTSISYQSNQCPGGALLNGQSNQAVTRVAADRSFIIAPDNFGAALPGQVVTYTHILTNTGNLTDTYTIVPKAGLYGVGEIVQPPFPSQITLGPLQMQTVVISVTISPAAAGGLPIPDTTSAIAINSTGDEESAANNTVISYTTGTRYVSLAGDDSIQDESDLTGVDYPDNNCTQVNQGVCRTIQHALDQAAPGDLIKIDQGVFSDVFSLTYQSQVINQTAFVDKPVMLQGGYDRMQAGGWEESPPNHISHTTILDPQALGRGLYIAASGVVTVDRLTLRNGAGDLGGNIYHDDAGDLVMHADRIQDGSAQSGGGLYSAGGKVLMQNSMLHGNQATSGDGGAMYVEAGAATLGNNTFYNNQAASGSGGAVYVAGGDLLVTNTIFADNSSGGGAVDGGAPATANLDYNLYSNNTVTDTGGIVPPPSLPNDVLGDPQFVNPGASPADLHVQAGSPARDTGDPGTGLTIDYDNDPRPLGLGFDIGADERVPQQGLLFYPDVVTDTLEGQPLVISHTLENEGDITETVTLSASSSQGWPIDYQPPLATPIELSAGVTHTVVVTYHVPAGSNGLTNVTLITATSEVSPDIFARVQDTITVKSAEWAIGKVVTPADGVQPGGYLTYTITITNVGDLPVQVPYTVSDELPTYTHFVSGTPDPDSSDPVAQWVGNTELPPGASDQFTYVVTVTQPLTDGTPIVNDHYWVAGGGAYTDGVGSPLTVTVEALASLTATKTASADLVRPGDYLTYTITITNDASAPGSALGAVVSDTLPGQMVYQSMGFVAPATGTITRTGNVLEWDLADYPIQPGVTAQVTATVRLTSPLASPLVLTNTYAVSATNIAAGLSGTLTTSLTSTNVITLDKQVSPTGVTPGQVVTYSITLTNTGDGIASVALTDLLPDTFSPATYDTNVPAPGRSWTTTAGVTSVAFTATTPMTAGIYYNQSVTATFGLSQVTLSHVAPVTVRSCWVQLNDDPTIYATVQAAVDASTQPTDVVKVAGYCAGVEARAGLTQTVYLTKTLTIRGGYTPSFAEPPDPLANPTTLDALGGGRVLYIAGTISPGIEGLRITGGDATDLGGDPGGENAGGGVYILAATAALTDNQVFGNLADFGGGVYLFQSPATLASNSVTTNTAYSNGGGVDVYDSSAGLFGNLIQGNEAYQGGGLYLDGSDATLAGNEVVSNTASSNGGGLYVLGSDAAVLSGNRVSYNNSTQYGGGMYLDASGALLVDNDVDHNQAASGAGMYLNASAANLNRNTLAFNVAESGDGGGLYLFTSGTARLSANLITSNIAQNDGGGLYLSESGAALEANTIISNTAGLGGGLYLLLSDAAFTNTVVANNQASSTGSGLYIAGSQPRLWHTSLADNVGGSGLYVTTYYMGEIGEHSTAWLTNTIIAGHAVGLEVTPDDTAVLESTLWWANGVDTQGTGTIISGTHNYTGDPDFVDPNAGDYHIGPASAAINRGVQAGVGMDIDAQPRPAGAYPDLGADEFPAALTISKGPDQQLVRSGDPVTFTISVTNSGYISLTNVVVSDPLATGCGRSVGDLAEGEGTTYTCTLAAATASFTNTALGFGDSASGVVSDSDIALVDVVTPSIAISKLPASQLVQSGDAATFTILLTNTGNISLTSVTVGDAQAEGCERLIDFLDPLDNTSYSCTVANVTAPFTNTAVVTGTPSIGNVVTDTGVAFVDVISPAIQIAKTPDSQMILHQGTALFTITLTNTGNITLPTVTVSDELAPTCDADFEDLAVGASESYTCTLTDVSADFTNTAVVTGTPPAGQVVTDTDTAFVDVTGPAIQIAKTPDTQSIIGGDSVTFTISLTNSGDVTLTNVSVLDVLVPNCDQTGGSLAAGATDSYTCTLENVTADITNTAVASGTPPVGPVVTDTDVAVVNVISPAIAVAKSPDSQTVLSGSTVVFTISVTNTGDVDLSDVAVLDPLASNCERGLGALTMGASGSYTCTLPGVDADLVNSATVTGTSPARSVVSDTDTAAVDVISPAIRIAKTPASQVVLMNDPVTFTISLTNSGDVTLTNVSVLDVLVPGCDREFESLAVGRGQSYSCTLASVTADFTNTAVVTGLSTLSSVVSDTASAFVDVTGAAIRIAKTPDVQTVLSGGTASFTISLTNTGDITLTGVVVGDALTPGCSGSLGDLDIGATYSYPCSLSNVTNDLTNTAVVTATPQGGGPAVHDSDTAFVDVTGPSVRIAKTPDVQTVLSGGTASFTIAVTNTGDITLTGVVVGDALAPGCGGSLGDLDIGATQSYMCSLSNVTNDLTNTALVTATQQGGGLEVYDSDIAFVDVISPGIRITKRPQVQTVLGGATVTFSIDLTNTGDVPLSDVVVLDPLAPNCSYTSASLALGATQAYTCTQGPVDADFINSALVTGVPSPGLVVSDSDMALVDVIHPAVQISKTPDSQTIASGGIATFTISLTNTGDVTLTGVAVSDVLVPVCDNTYASLSPGASDSYTCTRSSVITDFVNTAVISGTSSVLGEVVSDTDTASVTVQVPVAGLVAQNDSPTQLGGVTTLTATVAAGTGVAYTWDLGDSTTGSGAVVSHVYPSVGVYTALVTASNSVSVLTTTTVVTITEEPITGLVAVNDSPTLLGNTTGLTATITAGSNVTYTWAFGDGSGDTGAEVTHTYPATGTYTALVTASNRLGVMTATTLVTIEAPTSTALYLPIIMKNYTSLPLPPKPDLVVANISVDSSGPGDYTVQATVRNQSVVPVTYGNNFYVNVYVDPAEPFTGAQLPDPDIPPAIRWGVQGSWFGAGQSRVLTANCQVLAGNQLACTWYDGGHSSVPLGAGSEHRFYAWADAFDINPADAVVGTVDETDENNNYSGPLSVPIAGLGGSLAPAGELPPWPAPQPTPTNVP
jgi:uncharacterized repeat protein (TIGR01451 family)